MKTSRQLVNRPRFKPGTSTMHVRIFAVSANCLGHISYKICICRIQGSHSGDYDISIFWDITPCSPLKIKGRFGGTRCLHLQARIISQAGFFLGLLVDPEDGGDIFPPKRPLTFNGLHGVMSQMIEFFRSVFTTDVHSSVRNVSNSRQVWKSPPLSQISSGTQTTPLGILDSVLGTKSAGA
jgi:hypothetical protein